jgi:hypothetical protein
MGPETRYAKTADGAPGFDGRQISGRSPSPEKLHRTSTITKPPAGLITRDNVL